MLGIVQVLSPGIDKELLKASLKVDSSSLRVGGSSLNGLSLSKN